MARAEHAAAILTLHCVCVAVEILPLRTACLFQARSVCAGSTSSVQEPKCPLAEPFKAVAGSLRLTRPLIPHQRYPNLPALIDRVGFSQGTPFLLERPDPFSLFIVSNNL